MTETLSAPSTPVPFALRARYLFPVDAPPMRDGLITIAGEKIVAVGENSCGRPAIDLGNVALLPGLVNAHTHLEFSQLAAPLGRPGAPLPEWIRGVLIARGSQQDVSAAIRLGLDESLQAGTTTLGEIVTAGWSPADGQMEASIDHPASVTLFRELMGLTPPRVSAALTGAAEFLRSWQDASAAGTGAPRRRPALSPHAPYTVHPDLLSGAVDLSNQFGCALAMHVAESREELELLEAGRGPFQDLLQERGVWQPSVFGKRRASGILQAMARAPRALVIHGNYLRDDELDFLAASAGHMSLVYCPRTHARFEHEAYPLAKALAAGVQMAIGTDSRASNPDLSLLAELRHIVAHHPAVGPATVLRLGTIGGARALGRERDIGSLTPGKNADLAAVALPPHESSDPHELLLAAAGATVQTWIAGRRVYSQF